MIICSWNINSVRTRVELLKELIRNLQPDVILLQEIKCQDTEFPDVFKSLDYNIVTKGEKGKYGVAILLKNKIQFEEIKFDKKIFNEQARICGIQVKSNLYPDLSLINVYSPNGNPIENKEKFQFKINWLGELAKVAESFIENHKHFVIAGDFNVLDNENDVQDFKNWENDALGSLLSRKLFRKILSTGLTNAVRLFYEPGEKYSYWDYQKASWERNYGLLIDHFLLSPGVTQNIDKICFEKDFRGKNQPSDHIPLWIKLAIN